MCSSDNKRRGRLALAALAMLTMMCTGLTSCLKNDIPYPRIPVVFSSIECEGSLQEASIDSINRTVTFFLEEAANPYSVRITGYTLNPADGRWDEAGRFAEGVDMTSSVETKLTLYQDWYWSFIAVQEIERYFTVENQIGEANIDLPGKRIVANVPKGTDVARIRVLTIKLGGPEAQYSLDLAGTDVDFSAPVVLDVTEHGRTTQWKIYVVQSETNVAITSVDAWTNVAWVHAEGIDGADNRLEYRELGADEWIAVPEEWITRNGGLFTARLVHLRQEADYEARAFSGEEQSAPVSFTTETTYDIPDGGFDYWWLDGKVWCPWPEGGERYFDTGNKGATTLGSSNTYPTDDTPTGSGQAACLETRFVGIGVLGKLAAGNIFAGEYVRTDGTNGVLSFGRPFTLHPTRLKGWMKYTCTEISHTSKEMESYKGEPDQCIIWCALIDASTPFEIRTNPSNRQLFNPEADNVVAYGKIQVGVTVADWTRFDFELEYRDTSRTPRYMLLTASASWLGDYFTGGAGSTLWVDDFELGWDY